MQTRLSFRAPAFSLSSLKNLSIRARLVLLTAVAFFSLLTIGGFGLWQMRNINDNITQLADNYLPSVDATNRFAPALADIRLGTYAHALADNPEEIEKRNKQTADFIDVFEKARKVYEPLISSDEERILYKRFGADYDAYMALTDSFLALSRDLSKKREAQDFLKFKTREAFVAVVKDANALVALNMKGADDEHERSKAQFSETIIAFGILIGITLVVLGVMAFAIISGVSGGIGELARSIGALSALDLRVRGAIKNQDEIGRTLSQFNTTADTLTTVVRGTQEAADSVAAASHELTSSMDGISSIIQQQEASLTGIAAALEQTSASSQEVNSKTQRSGRTTLEVVRSIEHVVAQVNHLQQKAEQIGSVLEIIRSVSEQINLLSLNAAIEAARAGDAGRGFAVVADEVKKLAGHTSKSTDEIAGVVNELQRSVSETSAALNAVSGSLEDVRGSSEAVVAAVGQQTIAVKSISETIEEFRHQMTAVTSNIHEAQTASLSLSSAAEQLNRQSSQFKV